jgi:NAD(P)H-dependent flavin oxidoreductase YrpB (nitropropane dioxygenase family)
MGTRFITTVENQWDDDYKQAILDAGEGEDDVVGDTLGAPLRVFDTEGAAKLRAIEDETDDPREYIEADHHAMRRGQKGDLADGVVVAGQGGAYIDAIESVEALLETVNDEVEQAYDEISSYVD